MGKVITDAFFLKNKYVPEVGTESWKTTQLSKKNKWNRDQI